MLDSMFSLVDSNVKFQIFGWAVCLFVVKRSSLMSINTFQFKTDFLYYANFLSKVQGNPKNECSMGVRLWTNIGSVSDQIKTSYGRPSLTLYGYPSLTSIGEDISISCEHSQDVQLGYPTGPYLTFIGYTMDISVLVGKIEILNFN